MMTGRQALGSIESAIGTLYREESELDTSLRSAVGEAERLRKERVDTLRELARVKLDEMAAGRLVDNLDAGERRAVHILDDYRRRIAGVTERRDALIKEAASAKAERDAAAKEVEEALAAVEALRAEVEVKVQGEPAWQQAKAATDQANAVASEAEKKAANSEAELGAKKRPYDDDPLFVYLWQRGFGTRRYHSSNLVRLVDRMVADFIGFGEVRPNYAALIEIPLRLREHATAKRAEADERLAALSDIERRALVAAGIEPKEQTLAEARARLATADAALEEKLTQLSQVDAERNKLVAGGTNPAYEEALAAIAASDARDQIATLRLEAKRTPPLDDDAIVKDLEGLDGRIAKADAEVAGLRKTAKELAHRRLEIEQVRDRFRGAGYDHPHSRFDNEDQISEALNRTLRGAIGGAVLWDILQGGHVVRGPFGDPGFGYPTFPIPFPIPMPGGGPGPWGGEWRDPSSQGPWFPGGGDWGGGGGWGGGFGGGDFSTGGSFLVGQEGRPERDRAERRRGR
jgi:regulator of replication initiation timing